MIPFSLDKKMKEECAGSLQVVLKFSDLLVRTMFWPDMSLAMKFPALSRKHAVSLKGKEERKAPEGEGK